MSSKAQMVALIPVKKMDRAVKFYTKALGAKVVERPKGDMGDFWASLSVAGAGVWLVSPDKREKRKLAYHTFIVDDIKGFVADLDRRGVEFEKPERMSKETKIKGPIATDAMGSSAFFKDSEGNLLMAWQSPA